MILQELQTLLLYLQYSIVVDGQLVQCQIYIGSFQKLAITTLVVPPHFTVPSDNPLVQEGLNFCFGIIIEVENARTIDGNSFVKALLSWCLSSLRSYHKSNLSKTVGIAVVGVAFEYSLENGGREIKLSFQTY